MRFIVDVIRALIRIPATLFALIGFTMLGFVVAVLAAGDGRAEDVLGKVWFQHDPFSGFLSAPSIQMVQVFFERKLQMPYIWHPVITTVLNWPAWMALLTVGVGFLVVAMILFGVTGRRRRARA